MIEVWVEVETGKVEVTVRGETIKMSMAEAVRLRDGLSSMIVSEYVKGKLSD